MNDGPPILAPPAFDYLFKIVLIGDSGVGKSSILSQYVDHTFSSSYLSTIGVDFKIRSFQLEDKIVKLQIWDTAGQERFRSITSSYYKGAHGIMIVYDITEMESFNNVALWMNEIKKYAPATVDILLVGNKTDLCHLRMVDSKSGQDLAQRYEIGFLESSAKTAHNVNQVFLDLSVQLQKSFLLQHAAKEKHKLIVESLEKLNVNLIENDPLKKTSKRSTSFCQSC